jgi:transcription initiation factor TFIIH subunit 4
LSRLHVVTITAPNRDEPQVASLTKIFGASLRLALTGGGDHHSFGVPSNDSGTADIDLPFLDEYARAQWEGILHYVVSNVGDGMRLSGPGPTTGVKRLLELGKLVKGGRRADFTQNGFSFLLQEVNAQVWTLLLLWIENAEQVRLPQLPVNNY